MAHEKFLDLSYGENPHQNAALYVEIGRALARALPGREAARTGALVQQRARPRLGAPSSLAEFDEPAAVIVKHNNPCGVGDRATTSARPTRRRWRATRCRRSAGVIALNRPVDQALAERLHENFIEVLIAPGYEEDALDVLTPEGGDPDPRGRRAPRATSRASAT